jgi:hypothetical protein
MKNEGWIDGNGNGNEVPSLELGIETKIRSKRKINPK